MKLVLFISILLASFSCSKKATCKCTGNLDSETIDYSEEFKSSAKAQDACNTQKEKYENSNASFKSISCKVN